MSEITDRLRQAMELAGVPSIRALWAKLRDDGLFETTYSTAHRYLTGDVEPPLSFLRATAEATGVREPWLVLGLGTAKEEPAPIEQAGEKILREEFSGWQRLYAPTPAVRALLADLTERSMLPFKGFDLSVTTPEVGTYRDTFFELATDWWEEVRAPLDWIRQKRVARPGKRNTAGPDPRRFNRYAIAMLHALSLALDVEQEG